jgi:hypothetical protein
MTLRCAMAADTLRRACYVGSVVFLFAFLAVRSAAPGVSHAVIEPIYTLPFEGQYSIGQVYWDEHRAIDYTLGTAGAGGHPVLAAAQVAYRGGDLTRFLLKMGFLRRPPGGP